MGDYMAKLPPFTKNHVSYDTVEICASKRQVFTIESPGLSSTSDLASVENP